MPQCPHCGFVGPSAQGNCKRCGRPMYSTEDSYLREDRSRRSPRRPAQQRKRRVPWGVLTFVVVAASLLGLYYFDRPLFENIKDKATEYFERGLSGYRNIPKSAEFVVGRKMQLKCSSGVLDWRLEVPHPLEIPSSGPDRGAIQDVISVETTPVPDNGVPRFGQNMVWSGHLRSGQTATVVIRYHIKAHTMDWKMKASESGTASDVPQWYRDTFLRDEWLVDDDLPAPYDKYEGHHRIEPSNPQIQSLADQLSAKSGPTVYERVKAIYDYLVKNIRYPNRQQMQASAVNYAGKPKPAVATLDEALGDCDDQSILLASVARAMGIPVWLEGGALYDQLAQSWGGHGWANVFIPEPGCAAKADADGIPQPGTYRIASIDAVNALFLFRDCTRFSDWLDPGREDPEKANPSLYDISEYYTSWNYSYSGGAPPIVRSSEEFVQESFDPEGGINIAIPDSRKTPSELTTGDSSPGFGAGVLIASTAVLVVFIGLAHRRRR